MSSINRQTFLKSAIYFLVTFFINVTYIVWNWFQAKIILISQNIPYKAI